MKSPVLAPVGGRGVQSAVATPTGSKASAEVLRSTVRLEAEKDATAQRQDGGEKRVSKTGKTPPPVQDATHLLTKGLQSLIILDLPRLDDLFEVLKLSPHLRVASKFWRAGPIAIFQFRQGIDPLLKLDLLSKYALPEASSGL